MNMWLQWLLGLFVRSKGRSGLDLTAVSRLSYRVLPTDIDLLMHMNNGRYLSYMDLGRVDLTQRNGVQAKLSEHGIYAVVAAQTITYRKSLNLFTKFTIESRLIGADVRSFFIEQRFVVGGEVYARAIVRGRLIQKGVGTLKVEQIKQLTGIDLSQLEVPAEIEEWGESFRLPPTKAEAPSVWDPIRRIGSVERQGS